MYTLDQTIKAIIQHCIAPPPLRHTVPDGDALMDNTSIRRAATLPAAIMPWDQGVRKGVHFGPF